MQALEHHLHVFACCLLGRLSAPATSWPAIFRDPGTVLQSASARGRVVYPVDSPTMRESAAEQLEQHTIGTRVPGRGHEQATGPLRSKRVGVAGGRTTALRPLVQGAEAARFGCWLGSRPGQVWRRLSATAGSAATTSSLGVHQRPGATTRQRGRAPGAEDATRDRLEQHFAVQVMPGSNSCGARPTSRLAGVHHHALGGFRGSRVVGDQHQARCTARRRRPDPRMRLDQATSMR